MVINVGWGSHSAAQQETYLARYGNTGCTFGGVTTGPQGTGMGGGLNPTPDIAFSQSDNKPVVITCASAPSISLMSVVTLICMMGAF